MCVCVCVRVCVCVCVCVCAVAAGVIIWVNAVENVGVHVVAVLRDRSRTR